MHGFFLRYFMVAEILCDLAEQIWIDHNSLSTSVFSAVLCLCDAFLVTLLTLENGGRQSIDYTPFRSKDILEVLIIKALKINSPYSILIAAAIHRIDYATAAVIGLSLQRKRIFV